MASALATFLKNVGVSTSKGNGALDRCPMFNVKDKSIFGKFGTKGKKRVSLGACCNCVVSKNRFNEELPIILLSSSVQFVPTNIKKYKKSNSLDSNVKMFS